MCGFICYLKPPDSPFKLDREERVIPKDSWAVRKCNLYSLKIPGREKCLLEDVSFVPRDVPGIFPVSTV